MRCKRCGGLMVVERSLDTELQEALAGQGTLRCVNCGAMVNVRMLRNRANVHEEGGLPRNRYASPIGRQSVQDF